MSTTQKREQKVEGTESNKRLRIENNVVNKGERLTNLRTIEVEYENTEIELDLDWDKRIKQYRQEIEQEEQELSQRLQYKAIREGYFNHVGIVSKCTKFQLSSWGRSGHAN